MPALAAGLIEGVRGRDKAVRDGSRGGRRLRAARVTLARTAVAGSRYAATRREACSPCWPCRRGAWLQSGAERSQLSRGSASSLATKRRLALTAGLLAGVPGCDAAGRCWVTLLRWLGESARVSPDFASLRAR